MLLEALRNIYRKKFNATEDIEPHLFHEFTEIFNQAADEGFLQSVEPDEEFRKALRHNNAVFAAFKTHRMQNDMAAQLLDSNGNLKPFEQWKNDVQSIASHQCRAWLQTEYDTAVLRAHQAADWQQFMQEADVLPNLKWMPSTSPNPGADHMPFWGTILPIDDPFWDQHRPGDRWNCKCSLTSTDEPPTPVPSVAVSQQPKNTPQRGLENNPGKDAAVFSDKHPYFPSKCSQCFVYKNSKFTNRLKKQLLNRAKDCYNCPFIDGCIFGLEKSDIKEIKKEARKILQGSMLTHPEFSGKILVSRNSIDEWTNQPHIHYAEKNRMILYIDRVIKQSTYIDRVEDISGKPGTKWVHLFETTIQGDNTWIIVKEYQDGNKILYSISDSPNVLNDINEK